MKIVFNEREKKILGLLYNQLKIVRDRFMPPYTESLADWPLYYEKLPSEKPLDKFRAQSAYKMKKAKK